MLRRRARRQGRYRPTVSPVVQLRRSGADRLATARCRSALVLANSAMLAATGHDPLGSWVAVTYVLIFGPALAYSGVYWKRERATGVRVVKVIWLAHLYVGYSMMWYVSGWRAAGGAVRGRTGWAKTDRVTEAPPLEPPSLQRRSRMPVPDGPMPAAPEPDQPVPDRPKPNRPERPARRRMLVAVTAVVLAFAAAGSIVARNRHGRARHGRGGPVFDRLRLQVDRGHRTRAGQSCLRTGAGQRPRQVTHRGAGGLGPSATRTSPRRVNGADAAASFAAGRGRGAATRGRSAGWCGTTPQTSSFYALTLEAPPAGCCRSRIPAYRGDERFLAFGTNTADSAVGRPALRCGIIQIGQQDHDFARTVTCSPGSPTPSGRTWPARFGMYSEDSNGAVRGASAYATAADTSTRTEAAGGRCRPALLAHKAQNRQGFRCSDHKARPQPAEGCTRWPRTRGRIMVIYGTRPEAVKVAPLIQGPRRVAPLLHAR